MENLTKKRYAYLDTLRGITVVSMVLYHAMWDLVYLYNFDFNWYKGNLGYIWQQSICWTFIIISGFCWNFGRSKLKNGLKVFGAGILVTVATLIAMPNAPIVFGILTFLGSAMLIVTLTHRFLQKIPTIFGLICSFSFFALTKKISSGYLGFFSFKIFELPQMLYANYFTSYFGFTSKDFHSSDYFAILPWIFLFIFGYFLHEFAKDRKLLEKCKFGEIKVFSFIGRHALLIYMLHQVVIYGVLMLIDLVF